MKWTRILLATALSISPLLLTSADESYKDHKFAYFNSNNVYGPFTEESEDLTLEFSYYMKQNYANQRITEDIFVYSSEEMTSETRIYGERNDGHRVDGETTYNFTINFYPSLVFSQVDTCYIFVGVKLYYNNTLYLETLTFSLSEYKTPLVSKADVGSKKAIDNYLFILNRDIAQNEIYDLTNFPNEFKSGTYHHLDLDDLTFPLTTPITYEEYEGILYFYDRLGLFPNLRTYQLRYKYIELKIIISNGEMIFKVKNLFVDPKTFKISEARLSGYQKCNYFFFPLNTYGLIDSMVFYVSAKEVGANKSNILLSISYYPTNYLIGDCTKDDYCIIGGVRHG